MVGVYKAQRQIFHVTLLPGHVQEQAVETRRNAFVYPDPHRTYVVIITTVSELWINVNFEICPTRQTVVCQKDNLT